MRVSRYGLRATGLYWNNLNSKLATRNSQQLH
jgi:hypothetical protein